MTVQQPTHWPAHRPCLFDLHDLPTLEAAWPRTRATFAEMRACLEADPVEGVRSVVVSGSLGRMEQLPASDGDLIVVVDDRTAWDVDACGTAWNRVWDLIEPVGLARPRGHGIFSEVTSPSELGDLSTRGVIDERVGPYGRRIQLLLDAQPVYGSESYADVLTSVLERFADPSPGRSEWVYLLNESIRYFRSMCVSAQWEHREAAGAWRVRNGKLRHSRLLNYVGLLVSLGEASRQGVRDIAWLRERLKLTPLERVLAVADTESAREVMATYERFLELLADPAFVERLKADWPAGERHDPGATGEYGSLRENAHKLQVLLLHVVRQRQDQWTSRFREYLIV